MCRNSVWGLRREEVIETQRASPQSHLEDSMDLVSGDENEIVLNSCANFSNERMEKEE